MMHVFIVYEKDGYGGSQVAKVFANESEAIDYVKINISEISPSEHIEMHYVDCKGI